MSPSPLRVIEGSLGTRRASWLPYEFDWRDPDYQKVVAWRAAFYVRILESGQIAKMCAFYAEYPIKFIIDWGMTFDPRNLAMGRPSLIPFVPYERQIDWLEWALSRWISRERGINDKSRGCGVSWLAIALGCTLCNFNQGMVVGYGSRKEEYVDKTGDPKSLFYKARMFMDWLPPAFRRGWAREKDAPHMRILFPATGSAMTGESGDGIGRGDRTSLHFVDEAAFLEHPDEAEASLSDTTDCRIDISTSPGTMANTFSERRHALPAHQVFTFHWRDDPRRTDEWYAKKCTELTTAIVRREYGISYAASLDFVVIPSEWIEAAVDAHLKLGIEVQGGKRCALDVADQGIDKNAVIGRHGILLNYAKSWSGEGSDIYQTVVRTFGICDDMNYRGFSYDADGVGAGVRGDARVINEKRRDEGMSQIGNDPFQGSGSVYDPEGEMIPERPNNEFFANLKAQSWWHLRQRFEHTHRAIVEKCPYDPALLISIDSGIEELGQLLVELGQPVYKLNTVGKILIEKQPAGTRSPNLADAAMIAYSPAARWSEVWENL